MLVVRECADIQQVFRNSICSHFADHSWEHVETKVGGPLSRKKIEEFWSGDHHSCEGRVTHRLCWFFDKLLDDGIFIHSHDAASGGIGHLIYPQRCRKTLLLMEFKHSLQVDVRQHVSIENKERLFSGYKFAVFRHCSRAAEQFRFFRNPDLHSALLLRDKSPNCFRLCMCIDQNVSDSGSLAVVEP